MSGSWRIWTLAVASASLALAPLAVSAEEDPMDDILGGFEDDGGFDAEPADVADIEEPEVAAERLFRLKGDLSFGLSVSLHDHDSPSGSDYSGLQRFRTKLALQLDLDLPRGWKFRSSGYGFYDLAYAMNGRGGYTRDVLNAYELDFERTDTYLEGSLDERVDLKVGRQVVNWGRSESLRVLDIINPLDSREPGLVDIEDIRRSLGMAKLGFFVGPWTLTVLAIPEIRYDIQPPFGSDQSPDFADLLVADLVVPGPLAALRERIVTGIVELAVGSGALADFDEQVARDFGKATEFAINLTGVFSGWDVSLQAARYNDDRAHFDIENLRLEHSRLWMLGSGANYTLGSWLFKAEIAFVDGLEFLWTRDRKSRIDAMLGVEYYGLSDVNIVLEVAERHINDFEGPMELFLDFAQEDSLESALRVTVDLLNSRLQLTLLALALGEKAQDGSLVRLSAEYEVMDAMSVEAGFLLFQDGDNVFFANAGKNDRFFAGARYSF